MDGIAILAGPSRRRNWGRLRRGGVGHQSKGLSQDEESRAAIRLDGTDLLRGRHDLSLDCRWCHGVDQAIVGHEQADPAAALLKIYGRIR